MRAIVVRTGRVIEPFGEPPRAAAWAGTTLGAALDAAFSRRGIERTEIGMDELVPEIGAVAAGALPVLVMSDVCFVTDKCLGDFLDAALDVVGNTPAYAARLALAKTPAVDFVRPVSSIDVEPFDDDGPGARPKPSWLRKDVEAGERCAFDCFLVRPDALLRTGVLERSGALPASTAIAGAADGALATRPTGAALLAALRKHSVRVVVAKRELGIPLRMPVLGDAAGATTVVPITSTVAAHVEHWVHVLWLNQLAFGIRWMEIARDHKAWCVWRAFAAFPWTPTVPRLMTSFVKKGRGVRIHPSAHVEASILGDGVVIGARASVRNSVLGDGVEIGDHGTVLSSVIGARSYVTPRTFLVWSATYEDTVITNYKLQVSLVGRGASLSTWAGLIDAKLQGHVDVMHDGTRTSTERSFLGSCIGHGAFVGAKVLLLPGRSVPNGAFISMRPDELIVDVPATLPPGVPHVRDRGTLVPLSSLSTRS